MNAMKESSVLVDPMLTSDTRMQRREYMMYNDTTSAKSSIPTVALVDRNQNEQPTVISPETKPKLVVDHEPQVAPIHHTNIITKGWDNSCKNRDKIYR